MQGDEEPFCAEARRTMLGRGTRILPGVILCGLVTVASTAIEYIEWTAVGHSYLEALVIAILIGASIRTFWIPSKRYQFGIAFCAKRLLEFAVMLLGASISFAALASSGPLLLGAIVATVVLALSVSFGLSRLLQLPTRLSILIACGNSICGNSAIAAVAPIIGADSDDVACSISFTAILGVLMVLFLPLLIPLLHLSANQYGVVAGLTVYAVPQVLAVTVPAGLISVQLGTLVKLTRVLMLGPVVLGLSVFARRLRKEASIDAGARRGNIFDFIPWFIVGFVALAALRSFNIVPSEVVSPIERLTLYLTVVAMAALGLSVDVKALARVGSRVAVAATLSLLFLLSVSIGIALVLR